MSKVLKHLKELEEKIDSLSDKELLELMDGRVVYGRHYEKLCEMVLSDKQIDVYSPEFLRET